MVRRRLKRKVRVHLQSGVKLERGGASEVPGLTIEGVLAGETRGHYVIYAPKVLEGPEETVTVDGHVEIPRERVLFFQVLGD